MNMTAKLREVLGPEVGRQVPLPTGGLAEGPVMHWNHKARDVGLDLGPRLETRTDRRSEVLARTKLFDRLRPWVRPYMKRETVASIEASP